MLPPCAASGAQESGSAIQPRALRALTPVLPSPGRPRRQLRLSGSLGRWHRPHRAPVQVSSLGRIPRPGQQPAALGTGRLRSCPWSARPAAWLPHPVPLLPGRGRRRRGGTPPAASVTRGHPGLPYPGLQDPAAQTLGLGINAPSFQNPSYYSLRGQSY